MRKKISLMLMIIMLTGCFSILPIASANESRGCKEDVLAVLSEIGLLSSEETGEANLASVITRAEFSQYVAKILNITYADSGVLFQDIPADSFYIKSINGLVDAGVISVPGDLKFNPDAAIKYDEAVKMVVCAAGYSELATVKGGYPAGYIAVASESGMLDNVQVADKNSLTVGESLQILYNASTVGYYEKKC